MNARPRNTFIALFLSLCLWSLGAVAAEGEAVRRAQARCAELLEGMDPVPPFLDFVEDVDFEGVHEAYLDSGENGDVNVVWNEDSGRQHVRKQYKTQVGFENDRAGFLVLEKLFSESSQNVFALAQVLDVDDEGQQLRLEYIEGQELEELMRPGSSQLSPRQKLELESVYWQLMDFLEQGLDSLVESGWAGIRMVSKEKYRYRIKYVFTFVNHEGRLVATQILLKPDNVLLQKSPRRLVIIDPQ